MAELLFEIGCEEIPARFLVPALKSLDELARKELNFQELGFEKTETYGTPRRMALVIRGLAEMSADKEDLALGPPVKAAFDQNGQPTKAALGFARSQGVEVGALKEVETAKGPRLGYAKHIAGRPAMEILTEILPKLVGQLPFPKSMKWGAHSFRFARPIHWFVALLDGQVIPFEITGIKSGNQTRGHRFMSPAAIQVNGPDDYVAKLEAASVIVDRAKRAALVRQEVDAAAAQAGGQVVPNEALMQENTDLVEMAVACCGSFDKEFLEVPREVVISAMASHQRYFALENSSGGLLPNFIAVNNTRPKDLKVVTQGHERVLRARLSDARFFLDEDLKAPLMDNLKKLEVVTYHAKLGSSREKVQRHTALAKHLAGKLAPEQIDKVERAALLAKCDLVSEMVGEFPDLQGVIGAEYARRGGEDAAVAMAIKEHYMPVGGDAELPSGIMGTIVGLADRIDTICGLFGVDEKPSGAADPFALRRAAIAVIRLITEKDISLSLGDALEKSLANLKPWLTREAAQVKDEVLQFFAARFVGLLAEEGVGTDVAQAVLAVGLDDLTATRKRALALAAVKESPDFKPLAVGLKRVMNILRKESASVPQTPPDPALLTPGEELQLYEAYEALKTQARERFASGDYEGFLRDVGALKEPVDKFFDNILVNDPDEAVRKNRFALLNQIASLFGEFAEFTHLQLV
jgi:glycyl-tRNA synthetase beta chain